LILSRTIYLFYLEDTTTDVAEQIKVTAAAKRNTFISTTSASSSESETSFVAVNKKDLDSVGSISINAVSLLTGSYAQLIA
jgi:hypothetical protein